MSHLFIKTYFLLFTVVFVIRAYGDHTTGGFPSYGLLDFVYWNVLLSLILAVPAYIFVETIRPTKQNVKQTNISNSRKAKPMSSSAKLLILSVLISVGVFVGYWIGLLFIPDSAGLDDLIVPLGGAAVGAFLALISGYFILRSR